MPRTEIHSDSITIEQRPPIVDLADRDSDIIQADSGLIESDYAAEMAFNEEPVTIHLQRSTLPNSPNSVEVWVNGKGAEVLQNGRWMEITYLPTGRLITIKRKYLEVLARAKMDAVTTEIGTAPSGDPSNSARRDTSAIHSFSVIEDRNPKGAAWLVEVRRRNI